MKIKVGDKVYDPHVTPIMVILNQQDKTNIGTMPPGATRYAAVPADWSERRMAQWMDQLYESEPDVNSYGPAYYTDG